ncbi:MAG: hypothetical protein AB1578_22780 [Thermodesulfobacteriota bacterium]
MPDFRDVYKNRAEAFAEFVEAQRLPVSKAKFYEDAKRLQMVQTDKSVRLMDLLAYVKNELKIAPLTGQSLAERDQERERADLEIRKLRAEVAGKERADRKEDERWMEVIDHERQMAAFAGRVEEALRQLTALRVPELVHLCGGAPGRTGELNAGLEELYAAALTEAVRSHTQVVVFEAEELLEASDGSDLSDPSAGEEGERGEPGPGH